MTRLTGKELPMRCTSPLRAERRTPLPANLSAPPEDGQTPFRALAKECGLDLDIATVFESVRKFFENAVKGSIKK